MQSLYNKGERTPTGYLLAKGNSWKLPSKQNKTDKRTTIKQRNKTQAISGNRGYSPHTDIKAESPHCLIQHPHN